MELDDAAAVRESVIVGMVEEMVADADASVDGIISEVTSSVIMFLETSCWTAALLPSRREDGGANASVVVGATMAMAARAAAIESLAMVNDEPL